MQARPVSPETAFLAISSRIRDDNKATKKQRGPIWNSGMTEWKSPTPSEFRVFGVFRGSSDLCYLVPWLFTQFLSGTRRHTPHAFRGGFREEDAGNQPLALKSQVLGCVDHETRELHENSPGDMTALSQNSALRNLSAEASAKADPPRQLDTPSPPLPICGITVN
jgi:hypothetical protein